MSDSANYLVISGIQENGKPFRPRDWIDRISSTLASLDHSNRLHYSPSVQPCIIDGEKCLVVARGLEKSDPLAYRYVMDFAKSNKLRIHTDRRMGSRALPLFALVSTANKHQPELTV
jgi:Protein of unknown function (DUF3579)